MVCVTAHEGQGWAHPCCSPVRSQCSASCVMLAACGAAYHALCIRRRAEYQDWQLTNGSGERSSAGPGPGRCCCPPLLVGMRHHRHLVAEGGHCGAVRSVPTPAAAAVPLELPAPRLVLPSGLGSTTLGLGISHGQAGIWVLLLLEVAAGLGGGPEGCGWCRPPLPHHLGPAAALRVRGWRCLRVGSRLCRASMCVLLRNT